MKEKNRMQLPSCYIPAYLIFQKTHLYLLKWDSKKCCYLLPRNIVSEKLKPPGVVNAQMKEGKKQHSGENEREQEQENSTSISITLNLWAAPSAGEKKTHEQKEERLQIKMREDKTRRLAAWTPDDISSWLVASFLLSFSHWSISHSMWRCNECVCALNSWHMSNKQERCSFVSIVSGDGVGWMNVLLGGAGFRESGWGSNKEQQQHWVHLTCH